MHRAHGAARVQPVVDLDGDLLAQLLGGGAGVAQRLVDQRESVLRARRTEEVGHDAVQRQHQQTLDDHDIGGEPAAMMDDQARPRLERASGAHRDVDFGRLDRPAAVKSRCRRTGQCRILACDQHCSRAACQRIEPSAWRDHDSRPQRAERAGRDRGLESTLTERRDDVDAAVGAVQVGG
jgi:hypothetical protein